MSPRPRAPKLASVLRTATFPTDWVMGRLNPSAQINLSTSLANARAFTGPKALA